MNAAQLSKQTQDEYEKRLKKSGEEGLYRFILGQAIIKTDDVPTLYPEVEILNHAEAFFAAFRRTGNDNFFTIGRILRRAAHCLFREFRRRDSKYPDNGRFLRLVK